MIEQTAVMRRMLAMLLAALLLLGACGGGSDDEETEESSDEATTYVAQVASYELVAGREQRFLTGIVASGTGAVVSFGTVDLEFFYLGTREEPVDPPEPRGSAEATFIPIAGRGVPEEEDEPREVRPSEGLGVYEATGVTFDEAGTWGLRVEATIDGEDVIANTAFPVRAEPRVPAAGMPAPRTENPTIASLGANSPALDSRADEDEAVPDPEMHETTVAAALAAGRPVVLVISTPVYCVSQFCGPITDRVGELQETYGDRAEFIHIEVWEDFEEKKINAAAREWLQPGGTGDLQEPWVFLVGGDGIVKERFDNVASDKQLEDAVRRLVGVAGP